MAIEVSKELGTVRMDDCPRWPEEMNAQERKRNAGLHALAKRAREAGPTW
jgi:hypothetical protein